MRYLVTGGAGFIGSAAVQELVRRGERVAVIDDLSAGKEHNLAGVRDRIDFLRASITNSSALERACHAPAAPGRVVNIATGCRFTLKETLRLLETITGRPATMRHEPERAGDFRHSQADIQRARELLGYEPAIGFEEGLRRTWQWYCPEY